jgi:hypothetical protein
MLATVLLLVALSLHGCTVEAQNKPFKVFGVGLSKTGTSSLGAALEMMGFVFLGRLSAALH